MKRILPALPFLLLVAACQEKMLPTRLEVAQSSLSVESAAGQVQIELSSSESWSVTPDAPWCRVLPASGNGLGSVPTTLNIVFDENLTPDNRSCSLVFASGGLSETVRITQSHRQGILIPDQEFELEPEAQILRVPVWKGKDYTAEVTGDAGEWIQIVQTKAMEEEDLLLSVSENMSLSRSGQVKVRAGGQEETLSIRQKCGYVKFEDEQLERYSRQYDTDYDGRVSIEEAYAFRGGFGIPSGTTSVAGMEHFIHITYVNCFAQLDELDLRPFQDLYEIRVESRLKRLMVSGLSGLKTLVVRSSDIERLDLTGCLALTSITLSENNRLKELHLGNHPRLSEFMLSSSPLFHEISLSDMPGLVDCTICFMDGLVRCRLENLPALRGAYLYHNTALEEAVIKKCPVLEDISLEASGLSRFDLSAVPSVKAFYAHGSALETLNLSGSRQLQDLFLRCPLKALDLSGCPGLLRLEGAPAFPELDLSPCPLLKHVYVSDGSLTKLTARNNPALQSLYCYANRLQELDLSSCSGLEFLNFSYNLLDSVDLSACPRLRIIYATANPNLETIWLKSGIEYELIVYDESTTELKYL